MLVDGRRHGCQLMRKVTYAMGVSLDGYIVGPDGTFNWTVPGPELFRFATEEVGGIGVHLLGRRLYETMLYWEPDEDPPDDDEALREWARTWRALPKVVFSRTLATVRGNAHLSTDDLATEIDRWRAEPGEGDIAIGGATLAAQAAAADLIDEYRPRIYPVSVGGGIPFLPRDAARLDLTLVDARTLDGTVVCLRYRRDRTDRATPVP